MIDSLDIFEIKEDELVWIGSVEHIDEAVQWIRRHGQRKTSSFVVFSEKGQMTHYRTEGGTDMVQVEVAIQELRSFASKRQKTV
jgi:hypothetical protein